MDKLPRRAQYAVGADPCFDNVSKYREDHIKDVGTIHTFYLQDTPIFLGYVETINSLGDLVQNANPRCDWSF